jgi:hypothetical protein
VEYRDFQNPSYDLALPIAFTNRPPQVHPHHLVVRIARLLALRQTRCASDWAAAFVASVSTS